MEMTPNEARELFTWLITDTPQSSEKTLAVRWLIDSVVVDMMASRVKRDDDYALALAERITIARMAIYRHANPLQFTKRLTPEKWPRFAGG